MPTLSLLSHLVQASPKYNWARLLKPKFSKNKCTLFYGALRRQISGIKKVFLSFSSKFEGNTGYLRLGLLPWILWNLSSLIPLDLRKYPPLKKNRSVNALNTGILQKIRLRKLIKIKPTVNALNIVLTISLLEACTGANSPRFDNLPSILCEVQCSASLSISRCSYECWHASR